MKLEVVLNGTNENPYHRMGLKYNPFPQIAKAEIEPFVMRVQKLAGDPIPDTDYIREVLEGFSPEFIDLCCTRFRKGEMVRFKVRFE